LGADAVIIEIDIEIPTIHFKCYYLENRAVSVLMRRSEEKYKNAIG